MKLNRRDFLSGLGAATTILATHKIAAASLTGSLPAASQTSNRSANPEGIQWISTTQNNPWQPASGLSIETIEKWGILTSNTEVQLSQPKQTIDGFGGAFSELGWKALSAIPEKLREEIIELLFSESGANFNICRTPLGSSDFSLKWYSYDETPGDFNLENFSVNNDRETLIPYIKAALKIKPDLLTWASPWSPPTWMKKNGYYALAPAWPGAPSNGIRPEQQGTEGNDYFILEPRYLQTYANYFRRYIEEYRKAGINISSVMPQNEFNSAQPFPSCCWTPEGFNRFLPYLGKEMEKVNVDIMFGTMERPDPELVYKVLENKESAAVLSGVGIQWAGKGAMPYIHKRYPNLRIWASEQECGTGTNDWHFARYAWNLMKKYFQNGTTVYQYWNMVLGPDTRSTWGWPQNSLITVLPEQNTYRINHEYYLMRHFSRYVQPGAKYLPAPSYTGFENQLAFMNPDKSVVLVIQNEMSEELTVKVKVGQKLMTVPMPPDSFNTIVLNEAAYAA